MLSDILKEIQRTFFLSDEIVETLRKNLLIKIIFGDCTSQIENETIRNRIIIELISMLIIAHKNRWCFDSMPGETIEERLEPMFILIRAYLPESDILIKKIISVAVQDAMNDYEQDKLDGKANPLDAKEYDQVSTQGFWME